MKPRKPDPLPRIRITLSPADLLSPEDLSELTGGGDKSQAGSAAPKPRPDQNQPDAQPGGTGSIESV